VVAYTRGYVRHLIETYNATRVLLPTLPPIECMSGVRLLTRRERRRLRDIRRWHNGNLTAMAEEEEAAWPEGRVMVRAVDVGGLLAGIIEVVEAGKRDELSDEAIKEEEEEMEKQRKVDAEQGRGGGRKGIFRKPEEGVDEGRGKAGGNTKLSKPLEVGVDDEGRGRGPVEKLKGANAAGGAEVKEEQSIPQVDGEHDKPAPAGFIDAGRGLEDSTTPNDGRLNPLTRRHGRRREDREPALGRVIADGSYGFEEVRLECRYECRSRKDEDRFLWWDNYHLTTRAHEVMAGKMLRELTEVGFFEKSVAVARG
ncbi:hypothetical protein HK101_001257, partial [Irineochytrium annulatum]